MKLGEDLPSRDTVLKALCIQIRHLSEEKVNLGVENGSLRVTKQDIIALLMSPLRPTRSAEATRKAYQKIEQQ